MPPKIGKLSHVLLGESPNRNRPNNGSVIHPLIYGSLKLGGGTICMAFRQA
jgi:hypothetical protein